MASDVVRMEEEGKGEEVVSKGRTEGVAANASGKSLDVDEGQRQKRSRDRDDEGLGSRYSDRERPRARDYGGRPGYRMERGKGEGGRREERNPQGNGRRYGGYDRRPDFRQQGGRFRESQDDESRGRPRGSWSVPADESVSVRDEERGGERPHSGKFSSMAGRRENGGDDVVQNHEEEDARPVKRGRGNFTSFNPSAMMASEEENTRDLNPEFVPKSGYFYEHDDRQAIPQRYSSFGDRRGRPLMRFRDSQSERWSARRSTERIVHAPRVEDRWMPGQDGEDTPGLPKATPEIEPEKADPEKLDGSKTRDSERREDNGLAVKAKEEDSVKEEPKVPRRTFREFKEEPDGDREDRKKEEKDVKGHDERGRGMEGRRDRDDRWSGPQGERRGVGGSGNRDYYNRQNSGRGGSRYPEHHGFRADGRHLQERRREGVRWGGSSEDGGRWAGRSFPKKVEKWGHDLFEEVSKAPPPKEDDDDEFRAKVQALLAS
eukprot:TRINITY_DN2265_c0_g1_i1.p1 TRINITY_DN2265_c0_g1~~TRINITY_DN2265_c0_g1_i1.p1  ORF type:complete len:489 (+),score=121.74 TRINITY_DN2265_c0_g1_i1:137-1603(+)